MSSIQLPKFIQRYLKKYGQLYQKAYISFQLIARIQYAKCTAGIPLKNFLINNIKHNKHISEQIKIQMLEFLQKGISVEQFKFFDQSLKLGSHKQKIKFYPNSITTTAIFRHFKKISHFILLSGFKGIGKSYACCLYQILTDLVIDFVLKVKISDAQDILNIPWQYRQINKVFILNANQILQRKQTIEKLILQFTPIQKQLIQTTIQQDLHIFKNNPITYFNKMMNVFSHKKQIYSVLVFDQINKVIQNIKTVDYYRQKYNDYRSQTPPQNQYSQIMRLQNDLKKNKYDTTQYNNKKQQIQYLQERAEKLSHVKRFQSFIDNYETIFLSYFLISTMNVECQIIERLYSQSLNRNIYSFIDYFEIIEQQTHRREMICYFLQQLQDHKAIQFHKKKLSESNQKIQESGNNQKIQESESNQKELQIFSIKNNQVQQTIPKQIPDQNSQLLDRKILLATLQSNDNYIKKKRSIMFQQIQKEFKIQTPTIEQHLSVEQMRFNIISWIRHFYSSKKRPFIFTPQSISNYIKNKERQPLQIFTQQNVENIQDAKKKILFMINQIQQQILNQILRNLCSFIEREKNESLKLVKTIFLINVLEYISKISQKVLPGKLIINVKQFRWDMSQISHQVIKISMDRNLFTIQSNQNRYQITDLKIRVSFATHLLLQTKQLHHFYNLYLDSLTNYDACLVFRCLRTRSAAGSLIQHLLIKAIVNSNAFIIKNHNKSNSTIPISSEKQLSNKQIKQHSQIIEQNSQQKPSQQLQHQIIQQNKKQITSHQNPPLLTKLKEGLPCNFFRQFKSSQIKLIFDNIDPNKGYFFPIPKKISKIKQFSIIQSLMESIDHQSVICTKILEPIKRSTQKNVLDKSFCIDDNLDQTSKSIDFAIVKYEAKKYVEGFLVDVTIKLQIQEKIQSFMQSYLKFSDRNMKELEINKSSIIPTINYAIFMLETEKINVHKIALNLNKKFKQLQFHVQNEFEIKINQNKSLQMLKSIYIVQFRHIEFFTNAGQNQDHKLFKTLSEKVLDQMISKKS